MVYYVQTNLVPIIICVLLLSTRSFLSSKKETSQMIMDSMFFELILLSFCDIASYYFRGKSVLGCMIASTIYYIVFAISTYSWFLFICIRMEYHKSISDLIRKTGIPTVLLCAAILLNPIHGFFFTIDDTAIYHRGSGIMIAWIIEWGYLVSAFYINLRIFLKEKRYFRKREYGGYLIFDLPLAIAAVFQMLVYGVTSAQVGFMVALLMVYINGQSHQVFRDELTGLNNKNAFLSYRDSMHNRLRTINLTMIMIDVNHFKSINDTYGHLIGDQALRDTSQVLKNAANAFVNQSRIILYRYGGDEFVILGLEISANEVSELTRIIDNETEKMNAVNTEKGEKYTLSLSVGYASADCASTDSFDKLQEAADQRMYEIKQNMHNSLSK